MTMPFNPQNAQGLRRERRFSFLCVVALLFAAKNALGAQPAKNVRITRYTIDATLDPVRHSLREQAAVTFTVLEDAASLSMELNPALHIDSVTDATGKTLAAARGSASPRMVSVVPASRLRKGETATWTFTCGGVFDGNANPPEQVDRTDPPMASIGDPVSYLLYEAHWFPGNTSFADPFSATIHVHVPLGEQVFGSGPVATSHSDGNGGLAFDFHWAAGGFPGTLVAGRFRGPYGSPGNPSIHVFFIDKSTATTNLDGQKYAATAVRIFDRLLAKFGSPNTDRLNILELPDGSPPASSAPEIAAISGRQMAAMDSSRLLANTIAHQWWGEKVHPATKSDAWITNGMCRLEELAFFQEMVDREAFQDALFNISASALAYDKYPLAQAGRYPPSSPAFQSMTYDKGAMVLRMLQWQIGHAAFLQTLQAVQQKEGGSISSSQFEAFAEAASQRGLRTFFTQWLDTTGAPTLRDNWTLYRLGDNKGFRTIGEIIEDLDLFQMPVAVRIDTNGKTVTQRVEVSGPRTQFVIGDQRVPTKISLDPDRRLLRNSPELQVRMHVLRGKQMETTGDSAGAIREYRKALAIDNISSLASFRLGEVYFEQRNYQSAADAFRDALHGDGEPKWTEVWSDLKLGNVFDASGERERAVNEYHEALQTGDNSGGALDLARGYIEHAYTPEP